MVDDAADVADMLAAMLENIGQQVSVAYSGESALAVARKQRPQVALLDMAMPGMDGAELARRLRQEFLPSELALVAVTGFSEKQLGASAAGFDYHLLKPVTAEALVALLDALPLDKDGRKVND